MPSELVCRWRTLEEQTVDIGQREGFRKVADWHVLYRRAVQLNAKASHITDAMAQACFREMARLEGELAVIQGCEKLGAAKVEILLKNYDIGGPDFGSGLADATLRLMVSASDDLRPLLAERLQHHAL